MDRLRSPLPSQPVPQIAPNPAIVPANSAIGDPLPIPGPTTSQNSIAWWYEHPPTQRTFVVIRKVPNGSVNVAVPSEKVISVKSTFRISPLEFEEIAHGFGLDVATLKYQWHDPVVRLTEICLQSAIVDQPKIGSESKDSVALIFPMKKEGLQFGDTCAE